MSTEGAGFRLASDLGEIVSEQLEYRELLMEMTKRDLLLRYKQAVMGFAWAIFMPLINTALFSVIFTRVAPIQVDVPYPLFAYTGLLAWNFTASALRFSVNSLTSNVNLVTKVYFPREIFPLSAILVTLVDTAVGTTVLVALMAYFRVAPGLSVLALPAVLAVHIALTLALGLVLSMANLFYRDVKYLYELVITIWMFASSVLYPLDQVKGRLGLLLRLNPMTPILDAYRDVLLYGRSPFSESFAYAAALSLGSLVLAAVMFHRAEFKFAESV